MTALSEWIILLPMLWAHFQHSAEREPNGEALVLPSGVRISYSHLSFLAVRMHAQLLALGMAPGAKLMLFAPNSLAFVITALAAARAGFILAPLPIAFRQEELATFLSAANPRVIVTIPKLQTDLQKLLSGCAQPFTPVEPFSKGWGASQHSSAEASAPPTFNPQVIASLSEVPAIPQPEVIAPIPDCAVASPYLVVLPEEEVLASSTTLPLSSRTETPHEVSKEALPACPPLPLLPPPAAIEGSAPYTLQFSTGSTGQAKPVQRTHQQWYQEITHFEAATHIGPGDRVLGIAPMYHAHGFGNGLAAALWNGATLVVQEGFNAREAALLLTKERITIFPGIPFTFHMVATTRLKTASEPEAALADYSPLRLCFSAGAPLNAEISEKFRLRFGQPVRQLYGSTETGSLSLNTEQDADKEGAGASVGRPFVGVDVRLFDEAGIEVPLGEVGEIGIHSPAMVTGYLDLETATSESFRNGYFFPGDLGRFDERGLLYIVGRKSLFINVGGNKVDPAEVEAFLMTIPGIQDAAVVGAKTGIAGEWVKACVVKSPGNDLSSDAILQQCSRLLAEYKIPKIVEFYAELPRSPLGKLLRKYLS